MCSLSLFSLSLTRAYTHIGTRFCALLKAQIPEIMLMHLYIIASIFAHVCTPCLTKVTEAIIIAQ